MTAVSIVAEQQTWLAGNPGPPISPLSVALLLTFFALAFTASAGVAWSRRRNMNRQIWDELIRSGAHPAGPPPQ